MLKHFYHIATIAAVLPLTKMLVQYAFSC